MNIILKGFIRLIGLMVLWVLYGISSVQRVFAGLRIVVVPAMNRHERRAFHARVRTASRFGPNAGLSLRLRRQWHAVNTTTELNSLFNNIYEDSLFVLREMALMPMLVTPYSAKGYATRTVGIWTQGTAQTVGEGTDFNQAASFSKSTKATFTPGEVMVQFILTDRMIATDNVDSVQGAAAKEMGGAIAEKVDTDLLGLFASFTASKGTANNALTLGMVGAAIAKLYANNVRGVMNAVLHPYQWHDIWLELNKPGANYAFLGDIANQAMRQYFVSDWQGLRWFRSNNIDVDSNDDATGAVFGEEAIGLDVRDPYTVRPERDESLRAWELNGHTGYAYAIVRNEAGCKIISDATEPTS